MKRTLSAFLLLFASQAYAQSYVAFPDSNATWRQYTYANSFPQPYSSDFQYSIDNRDTVINGRTYSILHSKGWSTLGSFHDWDMTRGAIREDQKKVYFIEAGDTTQHLLYDFNLLLGDTLAPTYNNENFLFQVTGIDSVLITSAYHKRYEITHLQDQQQVFFIIEGIGSERGLMEAWEWFEASTSLNCFSKDSQVLYPHNSSFSSCDLVLTGQDEYIETGSYHIYPNPASSNLGINSSSGIAGYALYNAGGALVHHSQEASMSLEVNVSGYPRGIYLIVITGSNGDRTIHKIILE